MNWKKGKPFKSVIVISCGWCLQRLFSFLASSRYILAKDVIFDFAYLQPRNFGKPKWAYPHVRKIQITVRVIDISWIYRDTLTGASCNFADAHLIVGGEWTVVSVFIRKAPKERWGQKKWKNGRISWAPTTPNTNRGQFIFRRYFDMNNQRWVESAKIKWNDENTPFKFRIFLRYKFVVPYDLF